MDNFSQYPRTDKFKIVGTQGVPHEYYPNQELNNELTSSLGVLTASMILDHEMRTGRSSCGVPECPYRFERHGFLLMVEVDDDRHPNSIPELPAYIQQCTPLCQKEGFAGFTFKNKEKEK